MSDHLRFAGLSPDLQVEALLEIVRGAPFLVEALDELHGLELPDSWVVAGAIYNAVWNHLTGRPLLNGIKDVDVFYFDSSDLSYEAEDRIIQRAARVFERFPLPVEVRNQARVHLWYEAHFGEPCAPLQSSQDSIRHFASRTHAVALRRDGAGTIEVFAPFGLDDLFSFRVTPCFARAHNHETHAAKGARAQSIWPEITVVPWDASATLR